jgi:hypothetical protein
VEAAGPTSGESHLKVEGVGEVEEVEVIFFNFLNHFNPFNLSKPFLFISSPTT